MGGNVFNPCEAFGLMAWWWPWGQKSKVETVDDAALGDRPRSMSMYRSTFTDVNVTPQGAMGLSAVQAAFRLLSTSLMVPCETVADTTNGNTERVIIDPTSSILKRRTNPDLAAPHYWGIVVQHMLGWGNHYAAKIRNQQGRVAALYPLSPDCIQVYREGGEKRFVINNKDGFTKRDILHIPYLSYTEGLIGVSPIQLARERIGAGLAASMYQQRMYSQGNLSSGVLKIPGTLSQERRRELSEDWQAAYGGGSNAHKPIVLEQNSDFTPISINPVDAQFIQQMQFTDVEIARIFGIPATMLDAATNYSLKYDNPALNDHSYVKWAVRPLAVMIESAVSMDEDLFGINGEARAKFNLDALQRADIKTRSELAQTWIRTGVRNPNEVRELEDLPPREGGDEYLHGTDLTPGEQTNE